MKKAPAGVWRPSLHLVILCCFLITVGVLLLLMAGMLVPRISSLLEVNAIDRTRETVLQSTNSLEIYVENMLDTLHFASNLLSEQQRMSRQEMQAQLLLIQGAQRDIRNISFFGPEGELLHSTSDGLSISSTAVMALEFYQNARAWQGTIPFFSNPHVQHIFQGQHHWVVSVAKAVDYAYRGELRTGVLLIDYDFATLSGLAGSVQLGDSGYVYLVDTEDRFVFHPKQQLLYAGLATESLSALQTQIVGLFREEEAGRERILMINPVRQTRWRLVGVAYIDEILLLQSAFIRILTLSMLCGGLLSLAAATLTAYFVTRPIHYLQRKMRQVEEGQLDITVSTGGFKETLSLSRTFEEMLRRIRELMRQIVTEQEAKRLHELNALQAQINPHFLYNTLDSIIWMQERGRSREAIIMVSALAKLFRISISKGRNIITIQEEMEHVRNYLIIQKMRFRDQFTYELHPAEDTLALRTVKLIVQPLVENAVHHAIDTYNETVLHIDIAVERIRGRLVITVRDDGTGIPKQKLSGILSSPPGKSGIGLRNVHERIQLTCGKSYGLVVESEEEVGTTVRIVLPENLEEQA